MENSFDYLENLNEEDITAIEDYKGNILRAMNKDDNYVKTNFSSLDRSMEEIMKIVNYGNGRKSTITQAEVRSVFNNLISNVKDNNNVFVKNLLTSADDDQTALVTIDKDLSNEFNGIRGFKLDIDVDFINENGEIKTFPTINGKQVDICSRDIMNTPEETLAINITEYKNCLCYERDSKSSCSIKKDNYINKLTKNYNIDRSKLRDLNDEIGFLDGTSITEIELLERLSRSEVFKDILKVNLSMNVNSFKKDYIEFVMLTENTKIPESVLEFVTDVEKELFSGNKYNYSIYTLPYVLINDKKREEIKGDEKELRKINYYGYTSCMNPNCPGDGHGSKEFPLILPPLSYQKFLENDEIDVNVLPRFNICPHCKSVHIVPGKYVTLFKKYLETNLGKLEVDRRFNETDSVKIVVPDFNFFSKLFDKFYFKSKEDMENVWLDIKEQEAKQMAMMTGVDYEEDYSIEKESLVNDYVAVTSEKIRNMEDNFLENEDEIWDKWIAEFESRFVENYVIEEGSVKLGTFLGIDKDYIEERLIASDSLPEPSIKDYSDEEQFEKDMQTYKDRRSNADILKLKSIVVTVCNSLNLDFNDELKNAKSNVLTLLSHFMKVASANEFTEELKEVMDGNMDVLNNSALQVEERSNLEEENFYIRKNIENTWSKEKFLEKLEYVLSNYKYLLSIAKDVKEVCYIPSFVLNNKKCENLLAEIIYMNVLFRNRSKISGRISTCPREVSKVFTPTSIKKIRSFNLESIDKFTKLYNDFSLVDTYRYDEIKKVLSSAENSLPKLWEEEIEKIFNVQKQNKADNYSIGFLSLVNKIEKVETEDKEDLIYIKFFSKAYDLFKSEIITKLSKYYTKDFDENVFLKPILVNELTGFDKLNNEEKGKVIAHYNDFVRMENTGYVILKPENMSIDDYIANVISYNENHDAYKVISKEELANYNKLRFSVPVNIEELKRLLNTENVIIPILQDMNISKYYETLNLLRNETPVSFKEAYNNLRTSFIVPTIFDDDIDFICKERSLGAIDSFAGIVSYCREKGINIDANFYKVLSVLNEEINDEILGELIYFTYSFTSSNKKNILVPTYFDTYDTYIDKLKQCVYEPIVKTVNEVSMCNKIITSFDEFARYGLNREVVLLYRYSLANLNVSLENKNISFAEYVYELSKENPTHYKVDFYEIERLGYGEYLTDSVRNTITQSGVFLVPVYEESVSIYEQRLKESISLLNNTLHIVPLMNKSDDKFKVSVNNFESVYIKISQDLQILKTFVTALNNISESLKLGNSATFVGIKTLYCYLMLSINLNEYRTLIYKLFLKESIDEEDYTSSEDNAENNVVINTMVDDVDFNAIDDAMQNETDMEFLSIISDIKKTKSNTSTRKSTKSSSSSQEKKTKKLTNILQYVILSITATNKVISDKPRNIVGPVSDPLYNKDYDDLAMVKDFISNLSPFLSYRNRKVEDLDYLSFILYQGFNHYRDMIHGEIRAVVDNRFNELMGTNEKIDVTEEKEILIDFKTFSKDLLPAIKSLGKDAMKQFGSVNMRATKDNMMYTEEKWNEILPDLFTGEVRDEIMKLLK